MTTEKELIEDTPRTNECEAISYGYHDGFAFRFARQLERELNELQRKYDNHVDVCRGCNLKVRDAAYRSTFDQWYLRRVGISLEVAKRAGVTDLSLLEEAFNHSVTTTDHVI